MSFFILFGMQRMGRKTKENNKTFEEKIKLFKKNKNNKTVETSEKTNITQWERGMRNP